MKTKVAMIGAGNRAQTHYRVLNEMSDVILTAICELNQERMKTTAEKFRINYRFSDYKQMLKEVDADTVYIVMQPQYLDPIVVHCLKQGKNVFVEKPPGLDVEETRRWAKLAEENNCKTMVGF